MYDPQLFFRTKKTFKKIERKNFTTEGFVASYNMGLVECDNVESEDPSLEDDTYQSSQDLNL